MIVITKSQLSAELKVSKVRVSQYVEEGLPVRLDGRLNRKEALNWLRGRPGLSTVGVKGADLAQPIARQPKQEAGLPIEPHSTETDSLADFALDTALIARPQTEFEAGFIAGLVMAAHSVGALGALAAMESGANVEVGKKTEAVLTVCFMDRVEELMRCLPTYEAIPADEDLRGLMYDISRMTRVKWDAFTSEGAAYPPDA